MGARAGWRWISVVVMGRLPVRLSLSGTRCYGLQDKRRRVRITSVVHCAFSRSVFSFNFARFRRSRLSGKFMPTGSASSFTRAARPARSSNTMLHTSRGKTTRALVFPLSRSIRERERERARSLSRQTSVRNLCDLYQCE